LDPGRGADRAGGRRGVRVGGTVRPLRPGRRGGDTPGCRRRGRPVVGPHVPQGPGVGANRVARVALKPPMTTDIPTPDQGSWYQGVTRYQWLVLVLASAGWVFDVYEEQIFNVTRRDLLSEVVKPAPDQETILFYGDVFLGIFLVGGTLGGILFGSLADRWGRRPTLIVTILMYSVFSGLTFFASELWHVGVLRFLVALGV